MAEVISLANARAARAIGTSTARAALVEIRNDDACLAACYVSHYALCRDNDVGKMPHREALLETLATLLEDTRDAILEHGVHRIDETIAALRREAGRGGR